MELSELNLSPEQMELVTVYTKDLQDQLTAVTDELNKYKPVEKSETEKAIEERMKALEAREREIAQNERLQLVTGKLREKGLPEELSGVLNIGENVDADIEMLTATIGRFLTKETYHPTNHINSKGVTKEQFKAMSYMDRTKLYQENPELYKALSKQ